IWLVDRAAPAQQSPSPDVGLTSVVAIEGANYYGQLAEQEIASGEAEIVPGISPMLGQPLPAPTGGILCEPAGARACVFNSYWDITGGRRPTDYICTWGYGPDWCNAWEARAEWLIWFSRGRNAPPLATITTASGAVTEYPRDPIGT